MPRVTDMRHVPADRPTIDTNRAKRWFCLHLGLVGLTSVLITSNLRAQTKEKKSRETIDAFFAAIKTDQLEIVRLWLARGMDVNAFDSEGDPFWVGAVRHNASRVFQLILSVQDLQVDAKNKLGETALMIAALTGDLVKAKQLVSANAQINRFGWTPLHYAASAGQLEMMRWLIEHSAYLDAESPNRTTPLMMAARQDQIPAMTLLLEEGADPSCRNDAGLNAADYLARNGRMEAARRMDVAARAYRKRYDMDSPSKN